MQIVCFPMRSFKFLSEENNLHIRVMLVTVERHTFILLCLLELVIALVQKGQFIGMCIIIESNEPLTIRLVLL